MILPYYQMMLTNMRLTIQDLDQEAFSAVHTERSVSSDISSLLENNQQFASAFDEEANFCAGATQIHTHTLRKILHDGRGEEARSLPIQGSLEIGREDSICR